MSSTPRAHNYIVISDDNDANPVEIRYLADAKAHAWRLVRQRKATRADIWEVTAERQRKALVWRVERIRYGNREVTQRGLPIENQQAQDAPTSYKM